ncbi:MAG: MFS transporter, partial [Anaerolineae bacterium]|nr:MFS transporter [Anaerolineae bacterium]
RRARASAPVVALFSVYIEAELHQTPLFAASYRSIYMLLAGLFSIVGGALCDSLGRKRTFLLGLTSTAALAAAFLVGHPLLLLLLFLFAGMTTGLYTTAGQTYMLAAVPQTTIGLATAVYFLGYTLSNSVGSYAVGQIVAVASFRAAGLVLLALACLALVLAVIFLPSLPREGQGRSFAFAETLAGYWTIAVRPAVLLLLGIRSLTTIYWGAATLLIPLLIYRATQSPVAAAQYASISLLVAAGCQLLTGRWLDRVGFRVPVLLTITLLLVAAFLTALFATSVVGLFVLGVIGAAAAWSLATAIPGLVRQIADEAEQGRVLGATELVWSFSMIAGNLMGGQLVEWNASLPFLVAGLALLPVPLMAWRLFQREQSVKALAKM